MDWLHELVFISDAGRVALLGDRLGVYARAWPGQEKVLVQLRGESEVERGVAGGGPKVANLDQVVEWNLLDCGGPSPFPLV